MESIMEVGIIRTARSIGKHSSRFQVPGKIQIIFTFPWREIWHTNSPVFTANNSVIPAGNPVIPAQAGIQRSQRLTGYRVKPGMTMRR